MSKKQKKQTKLSGFEKFKKQLSSFISVVRPNSLAKKIALWVVIITAIPAFAMYGIAQWYIFTQKDIPLKIGATFIPNYAEYFGLDPQETLQATIDDLGIKRYRLVTYWKDYEPEPDQYNFEKLDWQFDMIEAAGGEISLSLGLRQPRWPECHGPEWAMEKSVPEWTEDLKEYVGVVIDRYKDREVLVEYQLENEYFMSLFGECPDFSRDRLIDEFNFVKNRDQTRPTIITRSNNTFGWPVRDPVPDIHAISVYKRVWDKTLTKRHFEYPYPAWYYAFYGGISKLTQDRPFFIHELQAEAWLPGGKNMINTPIDELYESLSPERLRDRIKYGVDTGVRTIDLWGVEWWYHMKTKRGAPELWNTAKSEFERLRSE